MKKFIPIVVLLFLTVELQLMAGSETRNLGSFSKMSASTGVNVLLIESDKEEIYVAVENANTSIVTTKNDGETLRIGMNPSFSSNVRVLVTVYYKTLTFIDVITSASIESETPINAKMLRLRATLGGKMKLELAVGLLKVSSNQNSTIRLSGECEFLDAKASIGGDLWAFDLIAQDAQVSASTGGKARVNVVGALQASSSAGTVEYRGASKLTTKTSLGGHVKENK